MIAKKAITWIILVVLVVTPFVNWRLGAVIWLCAWIIYVVQISLSSFQRRNSPGSLEDDE